VMWSWTRVNTWRECPARYSLKYLEKLTEPVVMAYQVGRRLHEAIEEYSRYCYERKVPRDEAWGPENAARYYEPALQEFVANGLPGLEFDWERVVVDGDSIERWFAVPLPEDKGELVGRVDLVLWNEAFGELTVVDYKAGWPAGHYDSTAVPEQLQLYAWAMRQVFPQAEHVYAKLYWPLAGVERSWEVWDADIAWFLRLVEAIEAAKDFPVNPGRHCHYCGYARHGCPLALEMDKHVVQSQGEAERVLAEIAALEQAKDQRKDALVAYCERTGATVEGGGLKARYSPRVKFEADPRQFEQALRRMGREPFEFAKLPSRKEVRRAVWNAFDDPWAVFEPDAKAALEKLTADPENPFADEGASELLAAIREEKTARFTIGK